MDGDSSLADQAFTKVRRMIVDRTLAAGDVLVESRLTDTLGLTRTPLREALVRLEGAGLLVKRKNRSFAVRQVGIAEFFQSLKVRKYLESQAARLAVGKIDTKDIKDFRRRVLALAKVKPHAPKHWILDDDLHNWLASAGGNEVLADTIRRLRITTQLFEIGRPFDRTQADAEEHLEILKALEDEDVDAAKQAVLTHLENIERDVLAIIRVG